ncbi:MAG: hypothetical protein V5A47_06020 [Bacteroidales bacterium]|nr:hypothetical protein [Bacteroidales bacterium]MBS3776262.1 hypothetical protein [Bacteroidales bacterium]
MRYIISRQWYRLIFSGLFLLLMPWGIVNAQSFQAEATLDTNKILIGDQIHLNLNIIQPEGARVSFPDIEKQVAPAIEILESSQRDTVNLDGNSIGVRQQFLVTSFDTGQVDLPSLRFPYTYDGRQGSVETSPVAMSVQAVRVDTTQNIFDIKPPFGAPVTFMEALPYIAGILGLILLGWLVYYIIKKWRRREPLIASRKPAEPAHVYARRELDKLKEEKLWQKDKVKLYYSRLSEILRTYLWMRYGIKTLERTTGEILDSLQKSDFSDENLYNRLEDTLRLSDLVKFAKMVPNPSENEQCLDFAYEFVDQTKYIAEQSEATNSSERGTDTLTDDKTEGEET